MLRARFFGGLERLIVSKLMRGFLLLFLLLWCWLDHSPSIDQMASKVPTGLLRIWIILINILSVCLLLKHPMQLSLVFIEARHLRKAVCANLSLSRVRKRHD